MDFWRPYNIKCAQKLRRTTTAFSKSIGMLFKDVIQHLIGTKIEEGARHIFSWQRKSIQSIWTCIEVKGPYCHKFWAHFSEYWHVFSRHFFCWVFCTVLADFG
jgi:hypothetical protein